MQTLCGPTQLYVRTARGARWTVAALYPFAGPDADAVPAHVYGVQLRDALRLRNGHVGLALDAVDATSRRASRRAPTRNRARPTPYDAPPTPHEAMSLL
jgi:hypothetical protein